MLRGFAIILGVLGLCALTVELYARSRERSRHRQAERVAERALLGGGLRGLLRARNMALGSAAMAGDTEAAATLALANAMLASEYGLDETNAALAAADAVDGTPGASARAQALMLASRALVAITTGHADLAEASARRSVDLGHKQASPLFALGRVRFRQGNLAAAAHAFQAALVREPAFVEPRVAWAEVWLEQGNRAKAREALRAALKQTPDHTRALLLLAEIPSASGPGPDPGWEAACARDEGTSPAIADKCALARAQQAWRRHDWDMAVSRAEAVGTHPPAEPRALGRAAQLLASAGMVDQAASILNLAAPMTRPLPSLRWARIAIALGRGQLVDLPKDLPAASSPWAPLIAARIALTSGGVKSLESNLPVLLGDGVSPEKPPGNDVGDSNPGSMDPARAYVKGMQALLAGNSARAAEWLARSLSRHGSACRAAGEYLALGDAVGKTPEIGAFAWLLDNNSQCVNLPAVFAAAEQKPRRKPAKRARRRAP